MQKKMLFLDGLLVPVSEAFVEFLSPGILLGKGVFETLRAYEGMVFLLEEHLTRLLEGLKYLQLKHPFSKDKMREYVFLSLRSNRLKNARLRLTVWEARHMVRISIMASPYYPLPSGTYRDGFKAVISDIKRDENSGLSRIKSINYLPLMMAHRRAKQKGYDEALLLNQSGFLAEGSRTNIFFIKGKTLYTPSLSCGCLNGITRGAILKIAHRMGLPCEETAAIPERLFDADEAFLTNSTIEVMPLTVVEGEVIGKGKIGPFTEKILEQYRQLVKEAVNLFNQFY